MNQKAKFLIAVFILAISTSTFAQLVISGQILDQETLTPIQHVNIRVEDQSGGCNSASDGTFILKTNKANANLILTSIGYKQRTINLTNSKNPVELGVITLQPQPYSLDEITINAGLKRESKLPVTISSISSRKIDNELGDRPLPLIMESIPGVFSIRNGGGSGDAKISIRGFQQENVSLLLNGIPINGEENGLVYWSNWLGLSNAAAEIQIQKGPGLANASARAIGGSVNIITRNAQKQKSGSLIFELSSYGNINTSIALNSGQLHNGWSTSLLLSFGSGPGWVDATYVKSWSYFFTAHKKINENHNITITLLGAPQEHGQRTLKLSNNEVTTKGLKYNKDWGGFNGQIKNASVNFYHKPFLSINDDIIINSKNTLSTSAYVSVGYGGGRWSESFNYAPSIFSYRDYSGQVDWENIYENNATHEGSYTLENGETVSGYSLNVQTNFLASHVQTGIMVNFEHKINENLNFTSGIHYRYFNSFLREEIDELLGGMFFIEDYSWSLAGVAGRNQIKTVGDIIRVDNNSIINYTVAYTQLVFNNNKINTYISINGNNNWYQRIDRFNYIENTTSDVVTKPGFDIRAGFLIKPNENQDLYINAAYISRAPYFKYVFGNFTNVVVKNIKNESIMTVELGYKLNWKYITANINGYITDRQNVSMLSNEYIQLDDNNQTRAMINGLNSLHKGVEFEMKTDIRNYFNIGGWLAISDFKWQNNVSATLFNDNNVAVDTVNVFVDGLYIGGTAQQQLGIFTNFVILKTIYLKVEYLYFSKLYADFDPTNRNNPNDHSQPFQLPSYGIINVYMGIPFNIGNHYGKLQINMYNLLNHTYIVNGEDGTGHDLETFRGFWSFSRNLTFSLKYNF